MKKIAIYLCSLLIQGFAFAQTEIIDEDEDWWVSLRFNDTTICTTICNKISACFIPIQDPEVWDSIYAEVFTVLRIDDNGRLEEVELHGYVEISKQGEYEEYIDADSLNPRLRTAIETTIERFVREQGVFIHSSKDSIRGMRNPFRLHIVRCPSTKNVEAADVGHATTEKDIHLLLFVAFFVGLVVIICMIIKNKAR